MMSFYFAGELDYPYMDISDVSTKSQSKKRVGTFTTATTRGAWAVALVALVMFSTFFSTMASSGGAERANAEVQVAAEDVCDNVEEEFFPSVPVIPYVGPKGDLGKHKFAFRYYNADEEIAGKPMKEWLRFAVAFWHTFRGDGSDPFGAPTKSWPWDEPPRNSASGRGGFCYI